MRFNNLIKIKIPEVKPLSLSQYSNFTIDQDVRKLIISW